MQPVQPRPQDLDAARVILRHTDRLVEGIPYPHNNKVRALIARIGKKVKYLDYLAAMEAGEEQKLAELLAEYTMTYAEGIDAANASNEADPWK